LVRNSISWCYFVALGLSEEVWKGDVPQNQRWRSPGIKWSASIWLSFSYSIRYYTDGTGHQPNWLLLESLWEMLAGYLQDGILSVSFFFLFYILCFSPLLNCFSGGACPA